MDKHDRLKTKKSILVPDPRSLLFSLNENDIGHFHKHVSSIRLKRSVPTDVRVQFEVAKNIFLYSFYSYRLGMAAQMYAYATLEKALSEKLKLENHPAPKHPSLKKLLNIALERRWIDDHALRHRAWRWRRHPRRDVRAGCSRLRDYLVGNDRFRGKRNILMHEPGQLDLPGETIESLKDVAGLVNQIFNKRPSKERRSKKAVWRT